MGSECLLQIRGGEGSVSGHDGITSVSRLDLVEFLALATISVSFMREYEVSYIET